MSVGHMSKSHTPNATYVRKDAAMWKKRGWTSTPNSLIRDPDLPPAVCWVWTWLASHTDEFEVSGLILWKANNHLGRNKAYEFLLELERRGLLLRRHEVDEYGVPYQIYDLQPVPVPEAERTWKPSKAADRKRPHPKKVARGQARKQAVQVAAQKPVSASTSEQDEFIHFPQVNSGFPEGRETAATCGNVEIERGGSFPMGRERVFPGGAGTGGAGKSYKEEKTSRKEHPSLSPSLAATTPGANEGEGGKEGRIRYDELPEPSGETVELVAGLEFGRFRRPNEAQCRQLAQLFELGKRDQGLTLREIRRHAQAAINDAKKAPISYLMKAPHGALLPGNLPVPMIKLAELHAPAGEPVAQREDGDAGAASEAPLSTTEARALIRAKLSETRNRRLTPTPGRPGNGPETATEHR